MKSKQTAEQRWRKYWWSMALIVAGVFFLQINLVWLMSLPVGAMGSVGFGFFVLAFALWGAGLLLGGLNEMSKAIKDRLMREIPALIGRVLVGAGLGVGFYLIPAPPPIFDGHMLFIAIIFGMTLGMIAHAFALYRFEPDPFLDGEEGVSC